MSSFRFHKIDRRWINALHCFLALNLARMQGRLMFSPSRKRREEERKWDRFSFFRQKMSACRAKRHTPRILTRIPQLSTHFAPRLLLLCNICIVRSHNCHKIFHYDFAILEKTVAIVSTHILFLSRISHLEIEACEPHVMSRSRVPHVFAVYSDTRLTRVAWVVHLFSSWCVCSPIASPSPVELSRLFWRVHSS